MSGRHSDVLIGLDLGTSGLKAVACLDTGAVIAREEVRYATFRHEPGASEQDPDDWLAAVRTAVSGLRREVPCARWLGIGLSGMIPTLVTTDDEGSPTGPAVTWEDARAEKQGDALRGVLDGPALYERTGQWLDGRYLLPMFVRLAEAEPDRVRETRWVLGAKDFLFSWLTGERVTDPSTATGFGCYGLREGSWLPEVCDVVEDMIGRELPALPDIRPTQYSAPLSEKVARELGLPLGLPIVLGMADSVAATFALGVCAPGDVAYVAGTSTVILCASEKLIVDAKHRYLVTPLADGASWGLEMDLLATGSAVRWLSGLFDCTEAELIDLAAERGSIGSPIFLPYLAPGEQGALWEPQLTGTLTGLGLQHDRADLAAALLAGLILESRRCLEVAAEATGISGVIRVTGAGAASPHFRSGLANASRRVVLAGDPGIDYSAAGAALLVAPAIGRQPDGSAPGIVTSAALSAIVADPVKSIEWDEAARRFERALNAVRSLEVSSPPTTGQAY
jgi:sugar (pentulose or hexulose) kinase